jgi:hypothetical protein
MLKIAQNIANEQEISPAIASLLSADVSGRGENLVPNLSFTKDELALLERTADVPTRELEAARRNLLATNADAFGYDIFRSVQSGAIEGLQSVTTFMNAIRRLSGQDTSIAWWTRVLTWNLEDLMVDAVNTDSTQTPGYKDKPQRTQDEMSLPFQIVHAGGVDPSSVAQARAAGLPINAYFAREAGKSIGRLMEKNALGNGTAGATYFGSLSNYGIYNDPNVVTGTLHAAWDTTTTPAEINTDVAAMLADLTSLGYPEDGPYILTVGSDYAQVMNSFINPTAGNGRVRDVLLEIMGIEEVIVSAYAPTAKVSLTYAGSVMPIAQLDLTTVPYGGYNGSEWGTQNWVFFSAMNVQHKVDMKSNFGVAVYSEPED